MANVISYLHPHMETSIVDNSTVASSQANTGTALFMPYFSSRGIDGQVEVYNSYAQFVADKGTPNFKRHGQPIYNILQFLRGGGTVYGVRLLPSDAVRANVALHAKVEGGKVVKAKDASYLTDLTSDNLAGLGLAGYEDVLVDVQREVAARYTFKVTQETVAQVFDGAKYYGTVAEAKVALKGVYAADELAKLDTLAKAKRTKAVEQVELSPVAGGNVVSFQLKEEPSRCLKVIKIESNTQPTEITLDKVYKTLEEAKQALSGKFAEKEIAKLDVLIAADLETEEVLNHLTEKFTATEKASNGVEGKMLQVVCKGRGVYGNKYSVNIAFNASLTSSYGFAIYELSVIESGNVVEGPYYVSLQPEAVNLAGASMYVKNIIEEYSSIIAVQVNEDLYDAAIEALAADGKEDYYKVDLLGLSTAVQVSLGEGTDGAKLDSKVEDDEDLTVRDSLLISAFSKADIQSKTRYPIDILLDANFSRGVKEALHALGKARGDVFMVLDLGPQGVSNATQALNNKDGMSNISDDRCAAFYAQTFTVYDSFTNSDILVTMPYFLAHKIPSNDLQYGIQYPLAGPTRGIITGFKSMSFNPSTDEKEELYKGRVNYAEQDYRSTKLMSQLTSQNASSALSNINNMRVLLRMMRRVEEISEGYFFEFASTSVLSRFEDSVNNYLSTWVSNGACTVANASVYQNDYDVTQNIVRVKVELVFTGVIERIIIEFNVGNNN